VTLRPLEVTFSGGRIARACGIEDTFKRLRQLRLL
jgi:hypothetical protein